MNRDKQSKPEKVIDTLALPKDLFLGVPVFTMYGNGELLIENHRGILIYGEDRMVVRARHFPICISGSHLCIDRYDEDSIRVLGRIAQISFQL